MDETSLRAAASHADLNIVSFCQIQILLSGELHIFLEVKSANKRSFTTDQHDLSAINIVQEDSK